MQNLVTSWYRRHFSDPQAIILALMLVAGLVVIIGFGDMLGPALASVVLAYILEALVSWLERIRVPRLIAVWVAFLLFVSLLVALTVGLLPLLWSQLSELITDQLPAMLVAGRHNLEMLPEKYPGFITTEQIDSIMRAIGDQVRGFGQKLVVAGSFNTLINTITMLIYLILVPLLVFFFLKDKEKLRAWFVSYLPDNRGLAKAVWVEMDHQIGNYLRGKVLEIVIVGLVSAITFGLLGLQYALLLGAIVGLSVIVPYVGAAVVTVPVAAIAFFQWGWSSEFAYAMLAYAVIQGLDGNLLVPLLFSEAVNLHPVAIVVAVLFFGGIWGFWGVFFAIPLATLVKTVLNIWPSLLPPDSSVAAADG
jgi:putative permease